MAPRRLLCCALPSVKVPEKLTQLKEKLSKGRRARRASSSEGQASFTDLGDEEQHAQRKQGEARPTMRSAARERTTCACSCRSCLPGIRHRCPTTHIRQAWAARPLWHDWRGP